MVSHRHLPPLPPPGQNPLPPLPPPPQSQNWGYNQHHHHHHHSFRPPPMYYAPPPPPPASPPPPPPPSSPPPPLPHPPSAPIKSEPRKRERSKDVKQHHHTHVPLHKHHRRSNETERERRLRKKIEFEKQRLHLNKVVLKPRAPSSSSARVHGSIGGSHMADRRTETFSRSEKIENRMKKTTTFLCRLKFRNELPDPASQPRLLSLIRDKDRYAKYSITSLEKLHKPQLYVEPDLGIPLDLLDLSVYNPTKGKIILDREDEELLRAEEPATPNKRDGLKRKERPTDIGVSWLVKTQYISPVNAEATKQSLRETRGGRNILDNFNNRERKIKAIEASFEACKSRPVHATNKKLEPVEILPLLPYFDRYNDQFVVATFDSPPTVDSDIYSKLNKSVRDVHESHAIMKSFVSTTSEAEANPDKFLAYMVPARNELPKDIYGDEEEDISYTWIREYHWDVRGDAADDPTTYLVSFGESEACYAPLPMKLILRKKRAKDGKTGDEVERFPVPSKVTVRRSTPTISPPESNKPGSNSSRKGKGRRISDSRARDKCMDESSDAESHSSD